MIATISQTKHQYWFRFLGYASKPYGFFLFVVRTVILSLVYIGKPTNIVIGMLHGPRRPIRYKPCGLHTFKIMVTSYNCFMLPNNFIYIYFLLILFLRLWLKHTRKFLQLIPLNKVSSPLLPFNDLRI